MARSRFDRRETTSTEPQVSPDAIRAARESRERYQRERPEWFVWIESGCPPLSPEEYDSLPGWHARARRRRATN